MRTSRGLAMNETRRALEDLIDSVREQAITDHNKEAEVSASLVALAIVELEGLDKSQGPTSEKAVVEAAPLATIRIAIDTLEGFPRFENFAPRFRAAVSAWRRATPPPE